MNRPEYPLVLQVNGRQLTRVVIDQHYKENHNELNDELILELVKTVDGGRFPIEKSNGDFEYFAYEPIWYLDKPYKIILMLCLSDDFLGVINAYRVRRKKYE